MNQSDKEYLMGAIAGLLVIGLIIANSDSVFHSDLYQMFLK